MTFSPLNQIDQFFILKARVLLLLEGKTKDIKHTHTHTHTHTHIVTDI